MFPPATPGSTLNEHPDVGIAYIPGVVVFI